MHWNFSGFFEDKSVRLIVEALEMVLIQVNTRSRSKELQVYFMILLIPSQDDKGCVNEAHSISAGLDYPELVLNIVIRKILGE